MLLLLLLHPVTTVTPSLPPSQYLSRQRTTFKPSSTTCEDQERFPFLWSKPSSSRSTNASLSHLAPSHPHWEAKQCQLEATREKRKQQPQLQEQRRQQPQLQAQQMQQPQWQQQQQMRDQQLQAKETGRVPLTLTESTEQLGRCTGAKTVQFTCAEQLGQLMHRCRREPFSLYVRATEEAPPSLCGCGGADRADLGPDSICFHKSSRSLEDGIHSEAKTSGTFPWPTGTFTAWQGIGTSHERCWGLPEQAAGSGEAHPGVRGSCRGLLPAGPLLEKRISPVSAFPPGSAAPWPPDLYRAQWLCRSNCTRDNPSDNRARVTVAYNIEVGIRDREIRCESRPIPVVSTGNAPSAEPGCVAESPKSGRMNRSVIMRTFGVSHAYLGPREQSSHSESNGASMRAKAKTVQFACAEQLGQIRRPLKASSV